MNHPVCDRLEQAGIRWLRDSGVKVQIKCQRLVDHRGTRIRRVQRPGSSVATQHPNPVLHIDHTETRDVEAKFATTGKSKVLQNVCPKSLSQIGSCGLRRQRVGLIGEQQRLGTRRRAGMKALAAGQHAAASLIHYRRITAHLHLRQFADDHFHCCATALVDVHLCCVLAQGALCRVEQCIEHVDYHRHHRHRHEHFEQGKSPLEAGPQRPVGGCDYHLLCNEIRCAELVRFKKEKRRVRMLRKLPGIPIRHQPIDLTVHQST